jgi:hypothetical protein
MNINKLDDFLCAVIDLILFILVNRIVMSVTVKLSIIVFGFGNLTEAVISDLKCKRVLCLKFFLDLRMLFSCHYY